MTTGAQPTVTVSYTYNMGGNVDYTIFDSLPDSNDIYAQTLRVNAHIYEVTKLKERFGEEGAAGLIATFLADEDADELSDVPLPALERKLTDYLAQQEWELRIGGERFSTFRAPSQDAALAEANRTLRWMRVEGYPIPGKATVRKIQ